MENDQSDDEISVKCDVLRSLTSSGGLRTSVAKLSGSSRGIPSEKDFHFYNNFQEFKNPVEEIYKKSRYLLEKVGESEKLFGKKIRFPSEKDVDLDDDVGLDWLVNIIDEILEGFDVSLDEFNARRDEEERTGVRNMKVDDENEGDGFQVVNGKKNKKSSHGSGRSRVGGGSVKMAEKLKPKVPFHLPSIPRPQDEYKIIVNNANQPFDHVWLQKSEDASRVLHPLEKYSFMHFVNKHDSIEPVEPLPIEVTPFKFVEEVKDLKQLAIKLRDVDEFAVDLEHNQYRSFQGMTCLMQISTRTEDFVIDTLKLRVHIGPHLREVFKDPTKTKVLHGANHDILWLQRDFGIYVCNMFDTGQASRVLKLERYSLEYLLNNLCGVSANKQYQNADWRIRPLPEEMLKYARDDTHYLLYIYDIMWMRLLSSLADPESSDPPLVDVYKRSYDICMQLYEKELLTDTSYLHIYGLYEARFSAQQLAVVSNQPASVTKFTNIVQGLNQWRDSVARSEDESTGYILPNKTLLEIAKQMPLTTNHLRRALKTKLPYMERHLSTVVSIIRHSVQNASQFEDGVKYLKERHLERIQSRERKALATEEPETSPSEDPAVANSGAAEDASGDPSANLKSNVAAKDRDGTNGRAIASSSSAHDREERHNDSNSQKLPEVSIQILKKPNRGLGAMLGNSSKTKLEPGTTVRVEENKLAQIKSYVSLPFHTFSGGNQLETKASGSPPKPSVSSSKNDLASPAKIKASMPLEEDIITLDDSDDEQPSPAAATSPKPPEINGEIEDEPTSMDELSSSFERCLASPDRGESPESAPPEISSPVQLKPFDYDAGRSQVKFGENPKELSEDSRGNTRRKDNKNKNSHHAQSRTDELSQGQRRQAFPASGNRSATFR